jgi:hypothetical protein
MTDTKTVRTSSTTGLKKMNPLLLPIYYQHTNQLEQVLEKERQIELLMKAESASKNEMNKLLD